MCFAVMDASDTKRKCYDATYKLVVNRTDQQSMRATAKEFGIDEKQVREWCRQKPELMHENVCRRTWETKAV